LGIGYSLGPLVLLLETGRQSEAAATDEHIHATRKDPGDCFLRLAALPTFPLDRLSRYEYMLWQQSQQIVFTLYSFRRRKRQPFRSTFSFPFRRGNSDEFK
jgi:hypothetical protein